MSIYFYPQQTRHDGAQEHIYRHDSVFLQGVGSGQRNPGDLERTPRVKLPSDSRLATGGVLAPLEPPFASCNGWSPQALRLRALTLATTWLYGRWRRRVSWPSDLHRTWMQGVFARCTLSNDLHAGHVLKFASTSSKPRSSKPRSTSPNRSPSRSCIGKACRLGEFRCCAKHQPCSHLRYAWSVADWALVAMLTVTSSSCSCRRRRWRGATARRFDAPPLRIVG